MDNVSINSAIAFTVYAFFMFYQNNHLRTLAAKKTSLYYALWVSTIIGGGVGIYWVYYYATHVVWYAPFMILTAAIVVLLFASTIEKLVPPGLFSLIGFVGWPIAAFFMFQYIPPAPFVEVQPEESTMLLIRLLVG